MNRKQFILTVISALFVACFVTAQEDNRDVLKSYSYIEAQGGMQLTATDAPADKLLTPTGAVSFGHYCYPYIGYRLHINGIKAKSGFSDTDQYYKWNYINTSADLLVNLTNLLSNNPQHPLNVILVGGIGLNYAWNNEELEKLNIPIDKAPLAWKDNRLGHNILAAIRLETDVTKPIGLSLEIGANNLCDRFNSKTNNSNDWMFTAMLGVSYRFNKRFHKPNPILVPVVQDVLETMSANVAPATSAISEKKPEPKHETKPKSTKTVAKKETLHEEIFYNICKSDPTEDGQVQMEKIARFMERHKDAKILIVGYADKGTGNPEINMKYAEQRAQKCKDALVKKYGCNPTNIIINSKGDTVQPFNEADKNRCTIIDSEAQYTVRE